MDLHMTRAARTAPIVLLGALLAASPHAATAQTVARSRIDTTFTFNKGASVDLGLISGEIIVTGWNRGEAHVVARIEEGELLTTFTSNHISIEPGSRRRYSGERHHGMGEAHYEVSVPIGTRVHASAVSGDIRVRATGGELQVSTVSGSIEATDAADRITISTVSGEVRASKLRGRTSISTTSGDLQLDDVAGDLSAHSVSGDIRTRRITSAHVRAETVSGEVTYSGSIDANGSYEFSTHSGDVRLEIPSGAGANLELQTFSGSISSSFPVTLQPDDGQRSRRGRQLQFTIGNGGARISAHAFSGDITIERSTRPDKEE